MEKNYSKETLLMAQCLTDAMDAIALSGFKDAKSEDIRTIGISLYIQAGKQANISSIKENKQKYTQKTNNVPTQNTQALGACAHCGANMLMSRAGNPYCSAKCWLKEEL